MNEMGEEVRAEAQDEAYRNAGRNYDEAEAYQEACCVLPDDLVERIVAMMPFPDIFKARTLSKSWQARFEPRDTHDDEVKRQLAASFQTKVSERSPNWKTLCPVFFDLEQGSLAYDRASDSSARIPSLSFIPRHILNCHEELHLEGALLLLCAEREHREMPPSNFLTRNLQNRRYPPRLKRLDRSRVVFGPTVQIEPVIQRMTMANLLTRRWKRLPPIPVTDFIERMSEFEGAYLFKRLLTLKSTPETYKVIVCIHLAGGEGQPNRYLAKIYDSNTNSWKRETLDTGAFHAYNNPTYLDGVLYISCRDPRKILAFNVEDETFEHLQWDADHRLLVNMGSRLAVSLIVCKADLLMVVIDHDTSEAVRVLKVDLKLKRLSELSRGPPPGLDFGNLYLPYGCDGENICFQYQSQHSGMVMYNLQENEWRHTFFPPAVRNIRHRHCLVSWRRFVFQPNLNPFLAV